MIILMILVIFPNYPSDWINSCWSNEFQAQSGNVGEDGRGPSLCEDLRNTDCGEGEEICGKWHILV